MRQHTPLPTSTPYSAWTDSLSFLLLTRTDAVVPQAHRVGVSGACAPIQHFRDRNYGSHVMTIDLLRLHTRQLSACRRCHSAGFPVAGVPVSPARSEDIPTLLSRKARILVVGQAPGRTEATGTQAFIGAAGRTLFNWFARAGIDEAGLRSSALIVAVTRCYPGPSATGRGDRVPTRIEVSLCRPWLEHERSLLRPSLIIPIGQMALHTMTGRSVLSEVIGKTIDSGGTTCIPLPHPSGSSAWTYGLGNRDRLEAALHLIGEWWNDHVGAESPSGSAVTCSDNPEGRSTR